MTLSAGMELDGKYTIEALIGEGGMGCVYRARHRVLDQRVAIKVLSVSGQSVATRRFLREARLAAKLRGENVVRVSDFAADSAHGPYLVMEYLEGTDLASLLESSGPVPVPLAIDYVLQALVGLAEAHDLGIIHRDFKPGNIFLARGPDGTETAKVMDFGISKALVDADTGEHSALTSTSLLIGTPYYCAPETLRGPRDATVRSDIWSIGVTLYQLITGRLPYESDSLADLVARIREQRPFPSVRQLVPTLPRELDEAIINCLAAVPDLRFQSVAELADAIAPFGPPQSRARSARIGRLLGADVPTQRMPAAQTSSPAISSEVVSSAVLSEALTGAASDSFAQVSAAELNEEEEAPATVRDVPVTMESQTPAPAKSAADWRAFASGAGAAALIVISMGLGLVTRMHLSNAHAAEARGEALASFTVSDAHVDRAAGAPLAETNLALLAPAPPATGTSATTSEALARQVDEDAAMLTRAARGSTRRSAPASSAPPSPRGAR